MTPIDQQLLLAANAGDLTSVLQCIFAGADVDTKFLGVTPLHFAAARGYGLIVLILLANNANQTLVDNEGYTAKEYSLGNGHTDVYMLLCNWNPQIYYQGENNHECQ